MQADSESQHLLKAYSGSQSAWSAALNQPQVIYPGTKSVPMQTAPTPPKGSKKKNNKKANLVV